MKNLKKVLSLALALVMAMSLMTTAFAADYADIDDVNYTEAVKVMTAVGVFNGMGDNKFAPTDTLNRAAAAKLIAYLDLGAEDADALTATGTVFTDVPADYWAAGYIEYMAAAGYTNGTGNDKFSPVATVTGLEFGKWLLTVLGYNANAEKMTGASWGIQTSKLANTINLFDGVAAKASANLTREAAAAYCLNALQATCVVYDSLGTDITIGDTTINTGASAAKPNTTHANVGQAPTLGSAITLQLGEKLYGAKLVKNAGIDDDFDRPGTSWSFDGKAIGTFVKDATYTFTNGIKYSTLYNTFGKDLATKQVYNGDATNTDATKYYVTVTVDGTPMSADDNYYVIPNTSASLPVAVNGSTTEIFVNNTAKTIEYVVTETRVAEVLADYNANTERVSISTLGFVDQKTADQDGFEVKDLKDGDVVLYTYANGNLQTLVKAELMTGVVNTYIAGSSVTVDGVEYEYTENFLNYDSNTVNAQYKLGETATFAMDGMGNIAAIIELTASADDNYVFVDHITPAGGRQNTTIMGDIVNVDGTTAKDVVISKINGVAADTIYSYYNTYGAWFSYVKDGDALKLTADTTNNYYATTTATGKLIETGKITVGASDATKANSSTVFVIKDANDVITTYTGIANIPTLTVDSGEAYAFYANGTDGFAKYVFIDMGSNVSSNAATTTSDDVFYILKSSGLKVVAGAKAGDEVEYYTLEVLKDGKVQNVDVLKSSGLADDTYKLYTSAKADSNNRVTSATYVDGVDDVKNYYGVDTVSNYYVSYSKNILTVKDGISAAAGVMDFVVSDDAVVYVINTGATALKADANATYEVQVLTVEQLAAMLNGYKASFTMTSFGVSDSDRSTLNTIYLQLTGVSQYM